MTVHFYWTYLETQKGLNYWYEQSLFVWYLLRQRNGGLNSGLKSATFVTDAYTFLSRIPCERTRGLRFCFFIIIIVGWSYV